MSQSISSTDRPRVIGIVGGVASGKSLVARLLQSRGASVINADLIAHELLDELEVQQSIVERFGTSVLDADGRIDRRSLGALVFGESSEAISKRRQLESIIHPRVRDVIRERLHILLHAKDLRYIVLDIPLLLENDWANACDRILLVDTPDSKRFEQALARGWSRDQWQAREDAQAPLSHKRSSATDVVVNDGTEQDLAQRLQQLFP